MRFLRKTFKLLGWTLHPIVIVPLCGVIFLYANSHPLLPGITACNWVRNNSAQSACVTRYFEAQSDSDVVSAVLGDYSGDGKALAQELRRTGHNNAVRVA